MESLSKLKTLSWAWTLWICALAPRILCALLAGTRNDDTDEIEIALNLLSGQGFKCVPAPHIVRYAYLPPGFPVLMAGYIKVIGMHWLPLHLALAAVGACVCWAVYRIGKELLGEGGARLAALWLALYPPQFFWSTRINPRTIGSHLLVFLLWILVRRRKTYAWALGTGTLWGVLTLFRGEYSAAAALVAAYIFWTVPFEPRKKLGIAAGFFAAFLLTLSPWLVRNWGLFHRVVIATNFGDNFHHAFNPRYDFTGNRHDDEMWAKLAGKSELEVQDGFTKEAIDYIRTDPVRILARTLGGNFLNFWRPYLSPGAVSWKENLLYTASYAPVFVFFLIGLFKIPWKEPGWALTGGLIIYQCLVHLPFYMVVHFREIIAPLMILVAAAGVSRYGRSGGSAGPGLREQTP